jgi:intracellular septation protein A
VRLFKRVMATYTAMRAADIATKHLNVTTWTPARNVMLGGGLAYTFSEEKYLHTPVVVVFPSVYAGYQAFKNRSRVAEFVRDMFV